MYTLQIESLDVMKRKLNQVKIKTCNQKKSYWLQFQFRDVKAQTESLKTFKTSYFTTFITISNNSLISHWSALLYIRDFAGFHWISVSLSLWGIMWL